MLTRVVSFLISVPLALSAAACSDPPPTPAAAGVSVTLSQPDPAIAGDRACTAGTVGTFTYQIGEPDPGKTIEDGKDGVKVTCLVKSDHNFNLSISGTDSNGHKPASFSFTGVVHDQNTPASNPGSMSSISPDTGQLVTLPDGPGCTFGPVGTLKPGAILTDVDCPLIGDTSENANGCKVHGTIAFEYCKTGDEQN
jgi:hypothetical protein